MDLPGLDYKTYLKEFRTIGCFLPRRSGKTTTLASLAKSTSCLLFKKYPDGFGNLIEFYDRNYRGRRFYNLKYSCILLDEYSKVPNEIYDLAEKLNYDELLSDNFFILSLSTPH